MRKITNIIIHCSASDNKHQDSIEAITKLHISPPIKKFTWGEYATSGKNFSAIGYHFVITKDGSVKVGRPLERQGAHCYRFNQFSIGICLTGNTYFSPEQFTSLHIICLELCQEFGLVLSNINPHNRFNSKKTCPNFDLKEQKELWVQ